MTEYQRALPVFSGSPTTVGVRVALASCIVLLHLGGSSIRAETPEPAEVGLFLDLDGDGGMSHEEFVQSLESRTMKALDGDRDGFLSGTEVKAGSKPKQHSAGLRFSEVDSDGDGRLSAAELKAATRKSSRVRVLYDQLDVDRNDRLSPSESRNASAGVGLLRIEF